jgi:hypothetical protein
MKKFAQNNTWKEICKGYLNFFMQVIIHFVLRVQMKSWAGKALETVNCYAFF